MASPRTVLILTPSSRLLGARRSLLALAESLDPERWRAIVCGQDYGQLGEALAERNIPMEVVKLGWWRKGKYFLWRPFAISRLASLARRLKVDLLHCNEIYPNPYAVRAARQVMAPGGSPRAGRPIPVVTHIRLDIKPNMVPKYDLLRAEKIVVPSAALARDLDEFDHEGKLIEVVYNGVNLDEFRRTRSREVARLQVGLPADGILLGAIGQIGPRKGGDIILEAFERLALKWPSMRLLFLGDPHRGQENFANSLRAWATKPPLAGRVHFVGFTPQVLPYYEACDINLLISRQEGFGRTIIEAGALGIPSIGAKVGGIQEIIVDGVTGRLVPPENADALAEAIEGMLRDEALRRQMSEAAFRRSVQEFSIAAHTRRMMDLYDEVLEG
ncbi:glycosyltransferase family 4 protein [bacterium]|nr:glycosyltransferase family 4 protein [bacterium]